MIKILTQGRGPRARNLALRWPGTLRAMRRSDAELRQRPWAVLGTGFLTHNLFFSVERFTGKETGRDRPAGVQGPTSTGKHQHHQSPNPNLMHFSPNPN